MTSEALTSGPTNEGVNASQIAPPTSETSTSEHTAHTDIERDAITSIPTETEKDATIAHATSRGSSSVTATDPLQLSRHRRDVSAKELRPQYGRRKARRLNKFYSQQNELIDQFLNSSDEERLEALDQIKNGPKVKIAIYASFGVNICLFIIQLSAAILTGSLSLFATTADAFMDLVSSIVMLITARAAKRESIYKYPVGRTRIETIGIILFCALMTTVAVQLIVESSRTFADGDPKNEDKELQVIPLACVGVAIAAKFCVLIYCFLLRRYPAAHIFMIDHRNDLAVNGFGLMMSILGQRYLWWLDPFGGLAIGCLILFSWVATAFDHVWLLVGRGAPREFLNKVIYVAMTHDKLITKVDTCRAYHAGQQYYVEVDVIMDESTPLKVSHDVSQALQRKLEGLADVERAFVHVDYEADHDVKTEHKPLFEKVEKRSLKDRLLRRKKEDENTNSEQGNAGEDGS